MNSAHRPQPALPCPNCRRLVSANAPKCIHCGLVRPGRIGSFPVLSDLIRGDISFVDFLIVLCFVMYIAALALDITGALAGRSNVVAMLSPSSEALYRLGMGGAIPWYAGQWWTILTANYLHGGIMHILFNMLWLKQIGALTEELFGASRFIVLYTAAGLAGSMLSTIAGTYLFVGASGAIFGIFGALIYYGWRRGGTFGSSIFRRMLIWAAIGFVFGFLMPGVDNWGHLGGFITGFAMAWILGYQEKARQSLPIHLVALLVMIGIGVCFAMMLYTYFFPPWA